MTRPCGKIVKESQGATQWLQERAQPGAWAHLQLDGGAVPAVLPWLGRCECDPPTALEALGGGPLQGAVRGCRL